ncbi:MAG TPA: PTS sugar transporter subunit IIA, partial [Negativicutes bacterium]|nr:PTS sugar transporter subunit IIA [Negativicutes bacterium]
MNLCSLVDNRLISFDFAAGSKEDIIHKAAEMMLKAEKISNKEKFIEEVFKREEEFTTGVGMGVAIPHCRSAVVIQPCFALLKLKTPLAWDSLDGEPVRYVIVLAAPENAANDFLNLLSTLSYNLMDDDFRAVLMNASSIEEIK